MIDSLKNAENFAHMWQKSRTDAGKSQEFMAKSLGVSKKTVQNWECGLSCPSQQMGFQWFEVLGLQPFPYYFRLIYPDIYKDDTPDDEDLDDILISIIKNTPPEFKRKLYHIYLGNHGSSVAGLTELVLAHIQLPLDNRIQMASSVLTAYKYAKASGNTTTDDIEVNVDFLQKCINNAFDSAIDHKRSYSILKGGDKDGKANENA